jgi:hypothetical protein
MPMRARHAAGACLLGGLTLEEEEENFAVLDGYRDRSGCNQDALVPARCDSLTLHHFFTPIT